MTINYIKSKGGITEPGQYGSKVKMSQYESAIPWAPEDLSSSLVGYWRADKGVELVAAPKPVLVDGDMEATGVTAWTTFLSTISKQPGTRPGGTGTQVLRITVTTSQGSGEQQGIGVAKGGTYRIRGWARSVNGQGIPYGDFAGGTLWWQGTNSTEWQAFDVTIISQYTSTGLALRNNGPDNSSVEFDDVTIERVDNGGFIYDGNMETDGYAVWNAFWGILSKQTNNPHSGTKCLRLTSDGSGISFVAYQSSLTIGNTYRVKGYCRSDGVTKPLIGYSAIYWTGTTSTDWQPFDVTFVAPSAQLGLACNNDVTIGRYIEFDDITVTCLNVTSWNDQSGLGHHLVQAVVNSRPTYLATASPKSGPLVRAATAGKFLKTAPFTLAQPTHIFVLAKWTANVTDISYLWDGNALVSGAAYRGPAPGDVYFRSNTQPVSLATPDATWIIYDMVYNGASSKVAVNGGVQTVGTVGADNMGGFTLFAAGSTGASAIADVCAIIISNRELTPFERASAVNYFKAMIETT